jgi:hypothetical protein
MCFISSIRLHDVSNDYGNLVSSFQCEASNAIMSELDNGCSIRFKSGYYRQDVCSEYWYVLPSRHAWLNSDGVERLVSYDTS